METRISTAVMSLYFNLRDLNRSIESSSIKMNAVVMPSICFNYIHAVRRTFTEEHRNIIIITSISCLTA